MGCLQQLTCLRSCDEWRASLSPWRRTGVCVDYGHVMSDELVCRCGDGQVHVWIAH